MVPMSAQKPTHEFRLQTPSIPELQQGLVMARMRLNVRGVKHRTRKLKDGPLLNALVAWFIAQPSEHQEQIAREGVRLFEGLLEGHQPEVTQGREVQGRTKQRGVG
jgi:hypothetical protein